MCVRMVRLFVGVGTWRYQDEGEPFWGRPSGSPARGAGGGETFCGSAGPALNAMVRFSGGSWPAASGQSSPEWRHAWSASTRTAWRSTRGATRTTVFATSALCEWPQPAVGPVCDFNVLFATLFGRARGTARPASGCCAGWVGRGLRGCWGWFWGCCRARPGGCGVVEKKTLEKIKPI